MKYNLKLITSVDIYVNIDHRVRVRVNKVVVYEGRSLKIANRINRKYTELMLKQLNEDNGVKNG